MGRYLHSLRSVDMTTKDGRYDNVIPSEVEGANYEEK